jgi:hypothetical protein
MSTCVTQESHERSLITLEALPRQHADADSASCQMTDGFPVLEKWNQNRLNIYRTFATFWCFLVMGANDAAYGVSEVKRSLSSWKLLIE